MTEKVQEFSATGRRKESVARVCLTAGTGKVKVNGKDFEVYYPDEVCRQSIVRPLVLTNYLDRFDLKISTSGGGKIGQAGAIKHGLARALLLADASTKEALKSGGYLTRDSRMKERKKTGQPGARRRFQFSKR